MTSDAIDALRTQRLAVLEVGLEPLGSPTFQPTTFANTGPSFYTDRDGRLAVVVDSVASVANQLEATVFDPDRGGPVDAVAALPWVRVLDADGRPYTTSRTAAHRLNAHTIWEGARDDGTPLKDWIARKAGEAPSPPIAPKLAAAVWELDPLSLLHGFWLAGLWDGRARAARALSGRIDAHGVQTQSVQVGGQKTADALAEVHATQSGAAGQTVMGEIPHHTSEVSAERIVARFLIDARTVRGHGLSEERERALLAVGLLELRTLCEDWPRRRSRCALTPIGPPRVVRPEGWKLPTLDELRDTCAELCTRASGVERAEPLTLRWTPPRS